MRETCERVKREVRRCKGVVRREQERRDGRGVGVESGREKGGKIAEGERGERERREISGGSVGENTFIYRYTFIYLLYPHIRQNIKY